MKMDYIKSYLRKVYSTNGGFTSTRVMSFSSSTIGLAKEGLSFNSDELLSRRRLQGWC